MKTSTGGMYSEEMQSLAWAFRSLVSRPFFAQENFHLSLEICSNLFVDLDLLYYLCTLCCFVLLRIRYCISCYSQSSLRPRRIFT